MDTTFSLDHAYSRHWSESYKTETSHAKPIQWLLPACRRNSHLKHTAFGQRYSSQNMNLSSDGSEDEIDVESLDEVMSPHTPGRTYDVQRARLHMNETERFTTQSLSLGKYPALEGRSEDDWESSLSKSSWSATQAKIYAKVLKVLEDEKLARLAYKGMNNEPIARRLSLDRSAACLRRHYAEFSWDQKLTQWLHSLLLNKLPPEMLACYLDLVQTLRSKAPTLVERMIMQTSAESNMVGSSSLHILLKRPWDPTLVKYPLAPKQRLHEPPIILTIPNSPYAPSPTMAHRRRFWNSHLSQLGKVICLSSPESTPGMTVLSFVEQLAAAARSKIETLRNKYPSRPVVLLGWHTASVLSCHVSLVEKVSAVICLGFPTKTMNGPRATVDDILCDMTTPTLFVVGENSDSCDIDKMEDFREQLLTQCETYLLAIPGADDSLRVSEKVKKRALVTQRMVDRMALDYVSKFFSEVLIKSSVGWNVVHPVGNKGSSGSYSKRRRKSSEDFELNMSKRRRLSSATNARILEVLASQSARGSRAPVQGVSYNLQTGSLAGMTKVPNVLGRSAAADPNSHKSKGRGRNQARSITIDLAKDAKSQLKRPKTFGAAPDPSLLATNSQTEEAVATILANDFPSEENLPVSISAPKANAQPAKPEITASKNSNDGIATSSSSHANASAASAFQPANARRPAYNNVKFKSTVVSKSTTPTTSQQDSGAYSTINTKEWAGIFDTAAKSPISAVSDFPRKYPYLPTAAAEAANRLSSRSRKEERETMQATAILEKLTSGIDNDQERDNQSGPTRAATLQRRHTHDTGTFITATRGRGRVRTRGGSAGARDAASKRRKTTLMERTAPVFPQKAVQQLGNMKPEAMTRYVVSSGIGTVLSGTASRVVAVAANASTAPVATLRPVVPVTKVAAKPTLLPVYSFTPPSSGTSIRLPQSFASANTSKGAFTVVPTKPAQQVSLKKPAKVIVGQRLPVKFPGAVPGSSYTFVTIPALTGPPLPAAGSKKVAVQARLKKDPVRYSVMARGSTGFTKAPILVSTNAGAAQSQPVTISIPGKTVPVRTTIIRPGGAISTAASKPGTPLTSPSVVLQKLWNDTVAEVGGAAANANASQEKKA